MNIHDCVGAFGCHQIPERSFSFRGRPMPLCARCFGAALGHFFSLGLFAAGIFLPLALCVAFLVALFVDWALQRWGGIMSTNPRRLIAGLLGGAGAGTLWWYTLSYLFVSLP